MGDDAATVLGAACTREDVLAAAERIKGLGTVHHTPLMSCSYFDDRSGLKLAFKCENLQRSGSFKIRGASAVISTLSEEQRAKGVVTHSSGNFAQSLSLAARLAGIPAHIIMPSNAPAVKRAAVEGYGGLVTLCEPTQAAREAAAAKKKAETGAELCHPYNDPRVIAGQGSIGLEILNDRPDTEAILVPVGGGGMIGGIALAANGAVRVVGAEPTAANDASVSKTSGTLTPNAAPPLTIADGLRTNLGNHTWPLVRDLVERIFEVSEEEIKEATRLVFERLKLVIEPSAGVGVAVCLRPEFQSWAKEAGIQKVTVVLCGGNVDLTQLPWQ